MPSKRTRILSSRISHTHYNLLYSKHGDKISALVRVLLNMYLNGRVPEADILLEHEVKRTQEAIQAHCGINATRNKQPVNINYKIAGKP